MRVPAAVAAHEHENRDDQGCMLMVNRPTIVEQAKGNGAVQVGHYTESNNKSGKRPTIDVLAFYLVSHEDGDLEVWGREEVLKRWRGVDDDCFQQQETVRRHACKTLIAHAPNEYTYRPIGVQLEIRVADDDTEFCLVTCDAQTE